MDEQAFTSSVETSGVCGHAMRWDLGQEESEGAPDLSTTRILVANSMPCNWGMQGSRPAMSHIAHRLGEPMGADCYVGRGRRRYAWQPGRDPPGGYSLAIP